MAEATPAALPDPNLPADYLERILTLVRQEHAPRVISDFIYSDPQSVKFVASPGSVKRAVTAVRIYFTPQTERGPISYNVLNRVVLFENGMLLKEVGLGDPELDWSAAEPPPPTDPNLPADFRDQLLNLERQRHPTWSITSLGFSDSARVLVHDPAQPASPVEMSGIVYSYGPMEKATGAPYLMIVQGAALFNRGVFVRTISQDDKSVDWTNGEPSVRPDGSGQRSQDGARRLATANRLFDPIMGPIERRSVRRQIWTKYGQAFDAMKLPPDTVAKLVDRLESVEEARAKAQHAASERGIDPFSAEMNRAIEAEEESAKRDLEALLGPAQTDRLEYLASARGYYRIVMANGDDVQLDLQDAGLPMTDDQIVAVGLVCEDVCDPKRDPDYAAMTRQPPNPNTRISAVCQGVLSRVAPLLTAEQVRVITLNLSDKSSRGPSGPAAQQRWARRRVMRDYGAAFAEMNLPANLLSKAKDLLVKRNEAPVTIIAEARENGEDPRSSQVRDAERLAADAVSGELKVLLGMAAYQRLEDLHEIIPLQRSVELVEATACRAMGCPMTRDQISNLGNVLWEVRKSLPPRNPGSLREEVDPATSLTARTTAILARSAAFLSPAQQAALKVGYQDQAATINRIADSQPPPPKRYPPPAASAGKGI